MPHMTFADERIYRSWALEMVTRANRRWASLWPTTGEGPPGGSVLVTRFNLHARIVEEALACGYLPTCLVYLPSELPKLAAGMMFRRPAWVRQVAIDYFEQLAAERVHVTVFNLMDEGNTSVGL